MHFPKQNTAFLVATACVFLVPILFGASMIYDMELFIGSDHAVSLINLSLSLVGVVLSFFLVGCLWIWLAPE